MDGFRAEGLGLLALEFLLERVRVKGGGEPLRTMLSIRGRPPYMGQDQSKY